MTLGAAPIDDRERDEHREQDDQVEGNDEKLQRRHGNIDKPGRASRGDQRAHYSEYDHRDGERGTGPAEPGCKSTRPAETSDVCASSSRSQPAKATPWT
jgi:hypothetical protein